MQLVLVMFRAEGERRSFSLTRDVTTIGRREDCDLRIPVSDVSRKHCRIIKDGGQVRVEDLGSSNGTYHNGQRIQGSTHVDAGDSIQVGPVVFVLQVDGMPADEELVPFQDRAAHELEDSVADAVGVGSGEPDVDTEAESLDEMMLGDGDASPMPLGDEPKTGEHSDAIPLGSEDSVIPLDDDHSVGIPLADPEASGEHEATLEHLDLESDDAAHTPLSEDELMLDLKDDHHEHK